DRVLVALAQVGAHRQAEHLARQLLGDGKRLALVLRGVRGLLVQRERIVHGGRDAAALELLLQARTVRRAHGVLGVYARAIRPQLERAHARRKRRKQLVVTPAERGAPLELPLEAPELGQHHGALDRVHAPADADARVVVAAALAVHADLAHGA